MNATLNTSQRTVARSVGSRKLICWALVALVAIGLVGGTLMLIWLPVRAQIRQAAWQAAGQGSYAIRAGRETVFSFDGLRDRVLVPDAPEFHFGSNQNFSVEAWIRAYPAPSRLAQRLQRLLAAHPSFARFAPRRMAAWVQTRARDNDFGVMPIVDKHQTPSFIEAVGFQFYLDHGRLAIQLACAPMRPLAFANYVSSGPNLQDGRWHHVAASIRRLSATGGKLYVDGREVFTFDPTQQAGDLSNAEPLRIGNHADPSLYCFFKGAIDAVVLYDRAVSAEEIAATFRAGRPER